MLIENIDITLIYPSARARPLDDDNVRAISASMADVGLLCPIVVRAVKRYHGGVLRDCFEIVAGNHRYRSAITLHWPTIRCSVVELDDLHAELAEIDENLIRHNLTSAQEAAAVSRRKAIYEELHPETKHGGDRKSDQVDNLSTRSERFTAETSKATGKDERTIRRAAARGAALGEDLAAITGTSLDKGVELDALAKMKPEDRKPIVERAKAGERVSARQIRPAHLTGHLARVLRARMKYLFSDPAWIDDGADEETARQYQRAENDLISCGRRRSSRARRPDDFLRHRAPNQKETEASRKQREGDVTAPPLLMLAEGRKPRIRKAPQVRPKEIELHMSVAALLRKRARPDWRWTHIPSGELRDARTAAKLKAMGMRPGWPDFALIAPGGRLHALELKRVGEGLSDVQEDFRMWCVRHGAPYAVAHDMRDVLIALNHWNALAATIMGDAQ